MLANLIAGHIHELDEATIDRMLIEMGFDEEADKMPEGGGSLFIEIGRPASLTR